MPEPRADRYLEEHGDVLVLRVPAEDLLARGALWTFGVAPLIVAAAWIGFWASGEDSVTAAAVLSGASALLAAIPGLVGLGLMATARRRSARTEVRIDRAERLLLLPKRAPQVFRDPETVCIARARPAGWRLSFRDAEGRETVLIHRAPHARGRVLAEVAEALASALDARAVVPSRARRAFSLIPRSTRLWAALCYAPVDGVLVAYSLWALVSSREPHLRFAAKQSLVQLALEGALGLSLLGCLGVPIAALSGELPFGVRLVGLVCPLSGLALVRVAARVTAAIRAHRGELWVMPWLAPLVRRWAPGQPEQRAAKSGPARPEPTARPVGRDTPIGGGPW